MALSFPPKQIHTQKGLRKHRIGCSTDSEMTRGSKTATLESVMTATRESVMTATLESVLFPAIIPGRRLLGVPPCLAAIIPGRRLLTASLPALPPSFPDRKSVV